MTILARKKATLTRAELLRQRHGTVAPASRVHTGAAAPRTVWEPRQRKAVPRAHRRIRLEEPGVEVQLPAVSLSVSPRGMALTIAAIAGGILLFLLTSPMFLASVPVVQGTNYIPADAVITASGVEGTNLFLVSPLEVNREVTSRIPGVRQVSAIVGFSGEVELEVVERAPILFWAQGGAEYWVDADGVIYPVTKPMEGLVRVEVRDEGPELAMDGAGDVDPGIVINALELAVSLPASSRIVFDMQHGLGMLDPAGMAVYFGTSGQIEQKMEIYRRLSQRFVATGVQPSLVDVRNIWQPFYVR